MGLDMYLYKAKRPEYQKDEEFIPKEWFTNRGFTVLIKEELHGLMDELLPYCQQDTAMLKLIDIKQIIIDNGCDPDDCNIYMSYYKNGKFCYQICREKENIKKVELTSEELEEQYTYESLEDIYVVNLEQMDYWREELDLRECVYNMLDYNVRNCEFKKLTMDQVAEILNYSDANREKDFAMEPETKNCAYFYYEWY